jgi:Alpha/beta hydrolase family
VTADEPTSAISGSPGRRRRILARVGIALLVVLGLAIAGFLWWAQPQPLLPEATAALGSTAGASFDQGSDGRLTFATTAGPAPVGLILYTGGKVPPAAYAPAARAIAEAGYLVAIVPAPLNFAIFDSGAAQGVIDDYPEITTWAVGGHSLGGATAALFIDGHPGLVRGLVLWASYSSVDLSADALRVSLSYGTLDQGAATFTDPATLARLGPDVTTTVIEGGNHEQMGWYAGQPNDPPATIPREEQQSRIVAATVDLLHSISGT